MNEALGLGLVVVSSAVEGFAQAIIFAPEVVHFAVAFRANVAAILSRRKLGRYADITAAEVMQ